MKRFLTGTDEAYADLKRQAEASAFVQFRDTEFPPGCVPPRGRTGVKVDPATGAAVLYVELGVRYYGPDATARRWFESGEMIFPTFDALRTWLTTDLKRLFAAPVAIEAPPGEASQELPHSRDPRAVPAPPSPGAPTHVDEPQSPPAGDRGQVCAPTADRLTGAPPPDTAAGRLVELIVRQLGARQGVEVRTVEPALLVDMVDRIRAADPDRDLERIVEEAVGDALALAAVEGHASVAVTAGPPVTCTPTAQFHD